MAYIGTKPTIGNFQICDAISVVNGQAAYTMQVGGVNVSPQSSNHMIVSLNGTIQKPGGANPSFTVSGSTITFASNLATGDVIDFIQILGDVLDLGVPSDATVTAAKLNNDIISGSTELASEPADTDEFLVSDAGTIKRIDYSLIKSSAGAYESQLLHVRQEVNAGTDSQTLSNSGANTRVLDTVKTNEITGASLSSNEITLPAGTYFCLASAPAYLTSNHQCRLYNTTDSADVLEGTTEHAWNNGYTTTHSFLRGRFTISGTKGFTLRHYVGQTRNDSGGGTGFSGGGSKNIYAEVMIWKVA
jgi:hypothetical protein